MVDNTYVPGLVEKTKVKVIVQHLYQEAGKIWSQAKDILTLANFPKFETHWLRTLAIVVDIALLVYGCIIFGGEIGRKMNLYAILLCAILLTIGVTTLCISDFKTKKASKFSAIMCLAKIIAAIMVTIYFSIKFSMKLLIFGIVMLLAEILMICLFVTRIISANAPVRRVAAERPIETTV